MSAPIASPAPSTASMRDRIVDVAAELFHEQGVHATTMRQIAARVGIKAGSLYNHFSGKQELLFTIAYETMRDMLDGGLRAIATEHTPEGRLRAFMYAHTLYSVKERYRARVADEIRDLTPEHLERVLRIRDEYEELLKDILQDGQTNAGWDVIDIPIFSYAFATMGSAVCTWYREGGRLSPHEIANMYTEITIRAVLPPPAARPS